MATEKQITGNLPALLSPLHRVVAGSSLVVYNLHHVFRMLVNRRKPQIVFSLVNKISRPLFSLLGFALIFSGIFYFPVSAIIGCCILGTISLSYSIPIIPGVARRRLREYGWFKIVSLAGVWTLATTLLPAQYHQVYSTAMYMAILPRFLFMFALCLLFDIRDIRTDVNNSIDTLPARLGLHRSYQLVYFLLAAWVILSVTSYQATLYTPALTATIITACATLPVILYLRKTKSTRAYLFLGDGMMLLYGLLVILL